MKPMVWLPTGNVPLRNSSVGLAPRRSWKPGGGLKRGTGESKGKSPPAGTWLGTWRRTAEAGDLREQTKPPMRQGERSEPSQRWARHAKDWWRAWRAASWIETVRCRASRGQKTKNGFWDWGRVLPERGE